MDSPRTIAEAERLLHENRRWTRIGGLVLLPDGRVLQYEREQLLLDSKPLSTCSAADGTVCLQHFHELLVSIVLRIDREIDAVIAATGTADTFVREVKASLGKETTEG